MKFLLWLTLLTGLFFTALGVMRELDLVLLFSGLSVVILSYVILMLPLYRWVCWTSIVFGISILGVGLLELTEHVTVQLAPLGLVLATAGVAGLVSADRVKPRGIFRRY